MPSFCIPSRKTGGIYFTYVFKQFFTPDSHKQRTINKRTFYNCNKKDCVTRHKTQIKCDGSHACVVVALEQGEFDSWITIASATRFPNPKVSPHGVKRLDYCWGSLIYSAIQWLRSCHYEHDSSWSWRILVNTEKTSFQKIIQLARCYSFL